MSGNAENTFLEVMKRLNGLNLSARVESIISSLPLIQELGMVLSLDDYLFTRQLRQLIITCRKHNAISDEDGCSLAFTQDRLELELCRFASAQEIPEGLARVMALYLLSSYSYNSFNNAGIFEHLACLGVLYRDRSNNVFVTGLHFKERTHIGCFRDVPELEAHYVRDCHLSAVNRQFVEGLPHLPGYFHTMNSVNERWGSEPDELTEHQEKVLIEWLTRRVA